MGEFAPGVYESLKTRRLLASLAEHTDLDPHFEHVDPDEAPEVLARHTALAVRRVLAQTPDDTTRRRLVNDLLVALEEVQDQLVEPTERLVALTRRVAPGVHLVRPITPLSDAVLLTNAPDEPSLSTELRSELASADRVGLLCAFIRWHGVRVLEEPLRGLRERGVPLRVLTTTYVGATERRALDELVRSFGAQVRISYETRSTRLHAKAWFLERDSGFDTAFVGSSNLSRSALLDGLEWNVRLSSVCTPDLVRKVKATFDTYWEDRSFTPYDPDRDADLLDDALARSAGRRDNNSTVTVSGLEVRPLPHQEAVLEALDAERVVHDRHRNLVVAATGTGKTVVAALDYRRLREAATDDLSLLFVAHRREILEQSRRTYREVLADGSFGELYVDGHRPDRWRHIFASVQSLTASGVAALRPDAFTVVVVDEFHHAEAPTYRQVLSHLDPQELLGLTATPERSDGFDVRRFFNGRTAYELRLWDALAADLLVPFHYFGIADDVDLGVVEWKRGAYDLDGLDRLYTGNDARAAKIIKALTHAVTDIGRMRALGFCVSVAHARYMARVFTEAGICARAVTGDTPRAERDQAVEDLRRGAVRCLFTVDLFNEGVDLPTVDTLLLMRPTQSATVFLQQLGRGLRRAQGKAVLTVLDFIGQQRREFRFDLRYRALTGTTRRGLERQIENGFPFLPSGCQLVLDRVSRQIVLDNVRTQLRLSRTQLAQDVRSHGEMSLSDYLGESGRELRDIYRSNGSWTALRRAAELQVPAPGPDDAALLRRISALTHVDDPQRARLYRHVVDQNGPDYDDLDETGRRLARMLFFTLWPNRNGHPTYQDGIAHLRAHQAVCEEIGQLLEHTLDVARTLPAQLPDPLGALPLASHAHYRREEILAAIDYAGEDRSARGNITGVAWSPDPGIDALMINLRKTEREFSPTTMYRDYAISPELFHWESQNATSVTSPAGRRYLHHVEHGTHVLLFVRDAPTDDLGAAPFLNLGSAEYVTHRGERPIAVTWRLHRPMPSATFRAASVVPA